MADMFVVDRSRGRILAGFVALMAAGFLYDRVTVTAQHSRLAVYQLPPVAVVSVACAALIAVAALAAAVLSARPWAAAITIVATVALLVGLFVFPLLLVAVGGGVLVARLISGLPAPQARLTIAAGIIAALAGVAVWTISSQPPRVRCLSGGGSEGSDRAWWGGSAGSNSSGGGTASADGVETGWEEIGGTRIAYTCSANGKLTSFRVTRAGGGG